MTEDSPRKSGLKPRLFSSGRVTLDAWWDRDTGQYYVPLWPELGSMSLEELKANPYPKWGDEKPCGPTAIIDTGLLLHHPWLAGSCGSSIDFTGEGVQDQHGHGTWVALCCVVTYLSLSSKVDFLKPLRPDLVNAKVMDRHEICEDEWIAKAIYWSVGMKCITVNLSIGYEGGCQPEEHSVMCEAIEYAVDKDCVVIVAATATCPAKCPNVIPVGGLLRGGTIMGTDAALLGPGETIRVPLGEPSRKGGRS